MEEARTPVIIAMKGHTCTGKSRWAQTLAKDLHWAVIDLDDVYDCFSGEHHVDAEDRSFEAICRIALKQLQLGIFNTVIVDSPLLHQAHMERLLQMSKSIGARMLIVECKPGDKYEWERRFMVHQRVGHGTRPYPYKPSTWEDLEKLLDMSWGEYEYDTSENVSKLVVDTTKHFRKVSLCMAVNDLCKYKQNYSMDFYAWAGKSYTPLEGEEELEVAPEIEGETERERMERKFGGPYSDIHRFTLSNEENDNADNMISRAVSCRACLKLISGPSYICSECDLSLHKSCAELPNKKLLLPHQHPPFVNPNSHEFSFPETHGCKFHPDGFEPRCRDCAFETNLRCALVPTIVNLECHKHPLFFMMITVLNESYNSHFQCDACGEMGGEAFYTCRQCPLIMHVNCALLPPTRKDKHHRHDLTLTPPRDHPDDEVYCDSCEKRRNPRNWIYYCGEYMCEFASHLYCDGFSPS